MYDLNVEVNPKVAPFTPCPLKGGLDSKFYSPFQGVGGKSRPYFCRSSASALTAITLPNRRPSEQSIRICTPSGILE